MSHTVSVEQQKKLKFCASASVCIRWQEGGAGVGASRSPTRSFALDAPPALFCLHFVPLRGPPPCFVIN